MTISDDAPTHTALPAHTSRVTLRLTRWFARDTLLHVCSAASRTLVKYARSGWIVVELAYVVALFLFAFRYPFDPPFFFESANWGLGLLTVCATLLLVARALRPPNFPTATGRGSRRVYIAGVALAAALLRLLTYSALLALALLTQSFINPTAGALLAGAVGGIAASVVLAALTLALSTECAPRLVRLLFLAWLTAALFSYAGAGPLAALFTPLRLPLLPLFACFDMGATGTVGAGGVLALVLTVAYTVGLVALATYWLERREAAQSSQADTPVSPTGEPAATSVGPERPAARSAVSTASGALSHPAPSTSRERRRLSPTRKRANH